MLRREEVVDITYWKRRGLSKRQIAAKLGVHRNTVSRYLENGGEHKPYDTGNRVSGLAPFYPGIRAWLEDDKYSATWMYDRLLPLGYVGSLRTVQRFVQKETGRLALKAFLRFETEPGHQAQVDFGELAVVDEQGNKVLTLYLFLMVLGFSRKRYAELMFRPNLPSFLDAHQRAFAFFGGVPTEILYDNMKNVVTRRNGSDPDWNDTFYSFALHHGFAPRLCPPYASWVKGKVERPIRFIREGFWRGYRFTGLHEANRDLLEWLIGKEKMIHGTTCQTVVERFETERPFLGSPAASPFDTSARHWRKVGKDCCVMYGRNRYMLPHRAVGKKVMLRVKDDVIRAYDGPELLVSYRIPEGRGHLVADKRFVEALKRDPEQNRMKYQTVPHRAKGAATTIGLEEEFSQIAVQIRDIALYEALAGGGHE